MNDRKVVYVVTCVDYGDAADGKARTLGVFSDKGKAEDCLARDMDEYRGSLSKVEMDDDCGIWADAHEGCEWNIEDVVVDDGEE